MSCGPSTDQHPYGMAGGRSEVTAPPSRHLAIQLALIVPLKGPVMQAQLAATQWSLSRKLDMACSLGAVPSSVRPYASSEELSPGQPRGRARSAPSRPRQSHCVDAEHQATDLAVGARARLEPRRLIPVPWGYRHPPPPPT